MPAVSDDSPVSRYLRSLHERFRALDDGAVATYIPELAEADPRWFGICLATVDGHVYEVGDTRQPFTIQSISKPFVYGLALEDRGKAAVLERIGVEPTGDAFNAISLESEHRPPAQSDDQRRRDRGDLARAGRFARRPLGAHPRAVLDVRRPRARARRGGLPLRARHRPSQSRDRPHAAQLRRSSSTTRSRLSTSTSGSARSRSTAATSA